MVTLFSRRPAADKKTPERGAERASPDWERTAYQNAQASGNSRDRHAQQPMSRPGTSSSSHAPYAASYSMKAFFDPAPPPKMPDAYQPRGYSPEPGQRFLKGSRSNPTMGMRRHNDSASSAGSAMGMPGTPGMPPHPVPEARPRTAGGYKPYVKPMGASYGEPMPVPPLRPYESQGYMHDEAAVPPPLMPYRPPTAHNDEPLSPAGPVPAIPPRSARRKPPSPAASVQASDDVDSQSFVESPIVPYAFRDMGSFGNGGPKNVPNALIPGGLRQLMDDDYMAYDPMSAPPNAPYSVPTPPPSLPRASGENSSRPSLSECDDGVIIQNVSAMKETTTRSASQRRSVEPGVEAERMENQPAYRDDLHPSRTQSPAGDNDRRPTLKLDIQPANRSVTPDWSGPRSAPFAKPQRAASPFEGSPLNPSRSESRSDSRSTSRSDSRSRVPAAAVGARGRPLRRINTQPHNQPGPQLRRVNTQPMNNEPVNPGPFSAGPMNVAPMSHGHINNGSIGAVSITGSISNGSISHGSISHGSISTGSLSHGSVSHGSVSHGSVSHGSVSHGSVTVNTATFNAGPQRVIPEAVALHPMSATRESFAYDSDEDSEPEEPDSPLLPRTGPLASPMILPPVEEPPRPQLSRNASERDYSTTNNFKGVSQIPKKSATMPDIHSKPAAAPEQITWPFFGSNGTIPESSAPVPPVRTNSPLAMPSFSRPYTPSGARPGTPSSQGTPQSSREPPTSTPMRGPSPARRGGAPPQRRKPNFGLDTLTDTPPRSGTPFF